MRCHRDEPGESLEKGQRRRREAEMNPKNFREAQRSPKEAAQWSREVTPPLEGPKIDFFQKEMNKITKEI